MGRPTRYRKDFDEEAYRLCLLGMTDAQLAEWFGVREQTINNWKHKHPTFFESLKKGKAHADGKVAESLYHRARGYHHPDTYITVHKGQVITVPITKHYPPDTAACCFWLKNRQKWSDKHEVDHKVEIKLLPPVIK
jgi:hypothetical protein